ncbi:MAG: hypothetical protein HYS27_24995 [Deltaproteobacteria bacterium]|nr:hypothetical protein [Deltaproteobacteria bacterium]
MKGVPGRCRPCTTFAAEVCLDLAIGIDVGFSASRRSTGVAIIDRATRQLAAGSSIVVDTAAGALTQLGASLSRLKPARVIFCVDGPFAPANLGGTARLVERFFMSGPFASAAVPRLRLSPAPTGLNSAFLGQTLDVLARLRALGYTPSVFTGSTLIGDALEIFPTIFMASLLGPHAYIGTRNRHTDDLWERLTLPSVHAFFQPYEPVVAAVAAQPRLAQHDARMAALCAIAADVTASNPVGAGQAAATFIGEPSEHGFIMPSRASMNPQFLAMLSNHWKARGGAPLCWA